MIELQKARHDADYDTEQSFTRTQVHILIRVTHNAFEAWARICKKPIGRAYLYYLLNPKLVHEHRKPLISG